MPTPTRAVDVLLAPAFGLALALALAACEGDPVATVEIALRAVPPGPGAGPLAAAVEVVNVGSRQVGPVELEVTALRFGGAALPSVPVRVTPGSVATLAPGRSSRVEVRLDSAAIAADGEYAIDLEARTAGTSAAIVLLFTVASGGVTASALELTGPSVAVQGDVVPVTVDARAADGTALADVVVGWRVEPAGAGLAMDGRFVGYTPGSIRVIAVSGSAADTLDVELRPRTGTLSFVEVGAGEVSERFTSDLWVRGDVVYTGTWGARNDGGVLRAGNLLHVWDVSNPAAPRRATSLTVEARTVNDVKVSADGSHAVITHELSNDGLNGISLLDLSDPLDPTVIGRYTDGLTAGVHNVWIDGGYVYVVVDGVGQGLRILDISDPARPFEVAQFYAGESILHDVYVRDGLAFLSHWDAGLVILDVGHGIAGGSPASPVEVSRVVTAGGQTHNAWYWPEGGYVFVGEEDYGTPGRLHVVDVRDLRNPREVATFAVPEATPHNVWLDEAESVLYAAWYEQGIQAIDVSGELLGQLDLQGRLLGSVQYDGYARNGCRIQPVTCTWAPQLQDGLLYASDMYSGLRVLRPARP